MLIEVSSTLPFWRIYFVPLKTYLINTETRYYFTSIDQWKYYCGSFRKKPIVRHQFKTIYISSEYHYWLDFANRKLLVFIRHVWQWYFFSKIITWFRFCKLYINRIDREVFSFFFCLLSEISFQKFRYKIITLGF